MDDESDWNQTLWGSCRGRDDSRHGVDAVRIFPNDAEQRGMSESGDGRGMLLWTGDPVEVGTLRVLLLVCCLEGLLLAAVAALFAVRMCLL